MNRFIVLCLLGIALTIPNKAQQIDIKAGGGVHQVQTIAYPISVDKEITFANPRLYLNIGSDISFKLYRKHWLNTGLSIGYQKHLHDMSYIVKSYTLVMPLTYQYRFSKFSISAGMDLSIMIFRNSSSYCAENNSYNFNFEKRTKLSDLLTLGTYGPDKPVQIRYLISPSFNITDEIQVYFQANLFFYSNSLILITNDENYGNKDYEFRYLCYWAALGIKYNLYKPEKYYIR